MIRHSDNRIFLYNNNNNNNIPKCLFIVLKNVYDI